MMGDLEGIKIISVNDDAKYAGKKNGLHNYEPIEPHVSEKELNLADIMTMYKANEDSPDMRNMLTNLSELSNKLKYEDPNKIIDYKANEVVFEGVKDQMNKETLTLKQKFSNMYDEETLTKDEAKKIKIGQMAEKNSREYINRLAEENNNFMICIEEAINPRIKKHKDFINLEEINQKIKPSFHDIKSLKCDRNDVIEQLNANEESCQSSDHLAKLSYFTLDKTSLRVLNIFDNTIDHMKTLINNDPIDLPNGMQNIVHILLKYQNDHKQALSNMDQNSLRILKICINTMNYMKTRIYNDPFPFDMHKSLEHLGDLLMQYISNIADKINGENSGQTPHIIDDTEKSVDEKTCNPQVGHCDLKTMLINKHRKFKSKCRGKKMHDEQKNINLPYKKYDELVNKIQNIIAEDNIDYCNAERYKGKGKGIQMTNDDIFNIVHGDLKKQVKFDDLNSYVKSLISETSFIIDSTKEKDTNIGDLRNEVEKKDANIGDLCGESEKKDAIIDGLHKKQKELEYQIHELQLNVKAKNEAIITTSLCMNKICKKMSFEHYFSD